MPWPVRCRPATSGWSGSIFAKGRWPNTHANTPRPARRREWLDLREGKLPNHDVEYPALGEPAAFACSNRICSFPSFDAEELQATVKQMAKLKPSRASLN